MHQMVKRGMTNNAAAKMAIELFKEALREAATDPADPRGSLGHAVQPEEETLMDLRQATAKLARTRPSGQPKKPPRHPG